MAFDTRSGFCLTSGPPGPAAPFAPQMCFQTAFVPNYTVDNQAFAWAGLGCQKNGSCIPNSMLVGACQYDEECGPNAVCDNGKCWPKDKPHSPWWYQSGNPRIVADMSWTQVEKILTAMGMKQQFEEFAKQYAFGKSMFIVEHEGRQSLAVPLNVTYFRQDPQCSTCLQSIWQCERFADGARSGDRESQKLYEKCQEYQKAFFFQTLRPEGVLIPIMVRVDPVSLVVAAAALQKCVQQCGDYVPNTPMSRGETALFY
jgi:hypothetical protein